MIRISLLAAGLVAVFAFATPAAPSGAMGPTKLKGTTGPGFTITLKKGTAAVKTLKRGKYTITVQDKSNIHNFRLRGPGVNKQITTLAYRGPKTVTVTLKKGTYSFLCDPHVAQGMIKRFKVT
jgi:plastocyanin